MEGIPFAIFQYRPALVMKTILLILHPTALRRKRFVTLAILRVEKRWFKVRTSAIVYSRVVRCIFKYGHAHFLSNTR